MRFVGPAFVGLSASNLFSFPSLLALIVPGATPAFASIGDGSANKPGAIRARRTRQRRRHLLRRGEKEEEENLLPPTLRHRRLDGDGGDKEEAEESWCHFYNVTAAVGAGGAPRVTKKFRTVVLEEGQTFPAEDLSRTVAGSCPEICDGTTNPGLLRHICPNLPGFESPRCDMDDDDKGNGKCVYDAKAGGNADDKEETDGPADETSAAGAADVVPWCYFHKQDGKFKDVTGTRDDVLGAEQFALFEGNPESRTYAEGTCDDACSLSLDLICPGPALGGGEDGDGKNDGGGNGDESYDCRRCGLPDGEGWRRCVYERYGDSDGCVDPAADMASMPSSDNW